MPFDFAHLMEAVRPDADGQFSIHPNAGWRQGKTLHGGLSAAIAVRAVEQAGLSPHAMRSAQFAFCGAAREEVQGRVWMLASGKSSDFVQVILRSAGETVLHALLCLGASRPADLSLDLLPSSSLPPPEACEPYFVQPWLPPFTANFEARLARGGAIASGADPDLTLWLRHRAAHPNDVPSSVVALADALPPAIMLAADAVIPVSSMTWHIDFLTQDYGGPSWYLARSRTEHARDGFSTQDMTLWDAEGVPVLRSRQTIAYYRSAATSAAG